MYFIFWVLFSLLGLGLGLGLRTTPIPIWRIPSNQVVRSSSGILNKSVWPPPSDPVEEEYGLNNDPVNGLSWASCSDYKGICKCQGWVRMSSFNLTLDDGFVTVSSATDDGDEKNRKNKDDMSKMVNSLLFDIGKMSPAVLVNSSIECTASSLRGRLWPEIRSLGFCEYRKFPKLKLRMGLYCLQAPPVPATNGWTGPGLTGNCDGTTERDFWIYHTASGQIRNNGNCLTANGGIPENRLWDSMTVTMQPCTVSDHKNFQSWTIPELANPVGAVQAQVADFRAGVGRITLRDAPSQLGMRCLAISDRQVPVTEPALFLEAKLCRDIRKSVTSEIYWEILGSEAGPTGPGEWQFCDKTGDPSCMQKCGRDCELRGRAGNLLTGEVSPNGETSEENFVCTVEGLRAQKFPTANEFDAACFCQPAGNVDEVWAPLHASLQSD